MNFCQGICLAGITIAALSLNACTFFEYNFGSEKKYDKQISGYYGQYATCEFPGSDNEPAQVTLLGTFRVGDKACGLAKVDKQKEVFILKPVTDSCKKFHKEEDSDESYVFITDFSIEVTKLADNKISIDMPNEETRVFERCTNINK